MTVVLDPTLTTGGGITLDDLVLRVKATLKERENLNVLTTGIDDTTTTFNLTYPLSGTTRGSTLSIDDETFYVLDTDPSRQTVSVRRGYAGTDAVSHVSNALVYIGGKTRSEIVNAINDELSSLSAKGLYQMKSLVIPNVSTGQWAYQVSALTNTSIYDVQWLVPSQNNDWEHLCDWQFNAIDNTIVFNDWPLWGNNVRVLYRTEFSRLENGDDDVQGTAGLQSEAADVLVWGAAWRLSAPDEYVRDDFRTQGDTRRPSEVPAGAVLRSSSMFMQMHDARLSEEKDRLRRRFPQRRIGW